ncbi:uncharacterized protein PITG_15102 [Phytophthora infestans T30-4]|uniref:Uncharacterized protein n=1 Tax=Phytophthora infestans (strain T30-4) TaxID=403677 RepID=D0NRN7_PHYIT|nr:uncharacterized protein PITG_15102 [Phytophthora infestans T30-4]EEY63387.1 hypothetical protein PITG_15102 [Phytophthora infestans T30-4]|eukprot:XP_002898272.1 hypothetical protein PITG_15102 [Phytophthora infestans T30-4]
MPNAAEDKVEKDAIATAAVAVAATTVSATPGSSATTATIPTPLHNRIMKQRMAMSFILVALSEKPAFWSATY